MNSAMKLLCFDRSGSLSGQSLSQGSTTDTWLRVDLGATHDIGFVQIYNRVGTCGSRLGSFELWLETEGGSETKCASAGVDVEPTNACANAML